MISSRLTRKNDPRSYTKGYEEEIEEMVRSTKSYKGPRVDIFFVRLCGPSWIVTDVLH